MEVFTRLRTLYCFVFLSQALLTRIIQNRHTDNSIYFELLI